MKVRRIDFYPDDWLAGVYRLTDSERGVYIQILMGIYSNGGPIDIEDARALCGRHFKPALETLLKHRKLTLTQQLIDSNRAVIELERASNRTANAQQNASKRWKNKEIANAGASGSAYAINHQSSIINHQDSAGAMREEKMRYNSNGLDDGEHKSDSLANPAPAARTRAELETAFSQFWNAYPRRDPHSNPRKPAFEKFISKVRAGADPAQIFEGARIYAEQRKAAGDGAKFTATAVVWLNQERWNDVLTGDPEMDRINRMFPANSTDPDDIQCRRWELEKYNAAKSTTGEI